MSKGSRSGRRRKALKLVGGGMLLIGVLGVGGVLTLEHWLFAALDPGAFDEAALPPEPDYDEDASWAALPGLDDGADVSLPEHPAIVQDQAPADVFYVHPTTWLGTRYNGPIDAEEVVVATERGGTLIQASAFNGCCAVYAPRYRQAHGKAFLDPDESSDKARDVAYSDVARAFREFMKRNGGARPFILAAHSQGTVHATRLLREEIWPSPARERLVAAYLIGGPVTAASIPAPVCRHAEDTGCVVGFNARGPAYKRNSFEFVEPMEGRICVSPLTWTETGSPHAEDNLGAVFFDSAEPQVLPHFADGTCRAGTLVVTQLGDAPRDLMSRLLDWSMGPQNYHPIEYQMFYLNLRKNAQRRVRAYLDSRSPGTSPSSSDKP